MSSIYLNSGQFSSLRLGTLVMSISKDNLGRKAGFDFSPSLGNGVKLGRRKVVNALQLLAEGELQDVYITFFCHLKDGGGDTQEIKNFAFSQPRKGLIHGIMDNLRFEIDDLIDYVEQYVEVEQ